MIEANTCLRVGLLFGGDSRFSTWSKEHYDKAFAEHDVLVVTGQIVVQALAHSFLKIEDLNLIVFDEAHHADATHPYSRIMKDYYFKTPSHKRPKIFGMTASPMKTATNHYQSAARELEGTLDAKIFTAPLSQNDKNELKQVRELVIEYDQPTQLPETDLTEKIKKRCASLESLPKYMHRMRYDLEHHGPLMLDLAWIGSRDAFRNKAREKFERTQLSRPQIDLLNKSWAEKQQFDRESRAMLEELDKKKKRWADEAFWHKAVAELLDEEMNVPRSLEANETNATPKVLTLINLLKCFDVDSKTRQNFCGIVFVGRKRTAIALVKLLLGQPSLNFLKVEALYGHDEVDGRNGMDSDAQQATLSRFRKGKTNLLVATSVAEEGLDILPCNCVIRFDLFAHHVAYVQSRGRARHKDSRFIMMVQRDDPVMHGILHKVARVDADIRKWLLDLPHDRLSQAFDDDSGDDSRGEKQEALSDYLEVAETGARIYPPESVFFLCHYVQIIKSDVYAPNVPDFIIREYDEGLGFSVEVRLPANSRVRYVQGPICPSKKMARNAASLLALKKLREAGELDDYLIPSARNKTKALRADLPFELDKDGRRMGTQARSHELHAKIPDAFAPGTPTEPIGGLELQGVVLRPPSTTEEAGEAAPYRPMLLLTVGAFKGMPAVDLMFAGGISRQFPVSEDTVLVRLDHREALAATRYTLRLFDYIGKKSYENDGRLPFLVLPLHQPIASRNFVDWMEVTQEAQITTLHDRGVFSYRFDPQDKLSPLMDEDLLLCDWKNPSRLYNFIDLDLEHDLRHIAPDRRSLRDIAPDEPGMCSQPTEPLIVTRVIPSLDNHLVTNAYKALGKRSARWTSYLIPSRAGAFPLSASTAETALLLPSILCRYSQILLSREANALLFHNQLDEGLLMHAFTAPSAQQLLNYEKLEFFGDMALKLIASLYAFTMTDSLREVELHYTRRAIISNAQLLKHSLRHQLHRFVHAKAFSGKTWRPLYLRAPNWSQEEARPSYRKRNTHIVSSEASHPASGCEEMLLSEKSLADLVEACLGAAFNKGGVNGIEAALFAMNKLGVLPREVEGLEAFRRAYALQTARESEGQNLAERVESGALQKVSPTFLHQSIEVILILGDVQLQEHIEYQFRSPHLALQAVTHSSYMAADLPSYERFEFLGDALLDYFIVSTFREKYSDTLDESAMTMIKSNAVANDAFGVLCIELGLHHYFSHSSSSMLSGIMQTVSDVMDARRRALDLYGGDEANIGQYWLKFGVRVPKVLADVSRAMCLSSVSTV